MDTAKYEILIKDDPTAPYSFIDDHYADRHDIAQIKIQQKNTLYNVYEYKIIYPKSYQRNLGVSEFY